MTCVVLQGNRTAEARFTRQNKNKELFTKRLTYGFNSISPYDDAMVVPKGAEVLLETACLT